MTCFSIFVAKVTNQTYRLVFENYEKWCMENKIKELSNEKALLVYFRELSISRKPSSLWCYYSMLKTELSIRKNVNVKKDINLIAFLKRQSEGYNSKKKDLQKEEITSFFKTVDNSKLFFLGNEFISFPNNASSN